MITTICVLMVLFFGLLASTPLLSSETVIAQDHPTNHKGSTTL